MKRRHDGLTGNHHHSPIVHSPSTSTRPSHLLREALAWAKHGWLLPQVTKPVKTTGHEEHLTVFIHGYMSSGGVFRPLGEQLAALGISQRQLHFTYLPTKSVEEHARKLAAAIHDLHMHGPVYIVGHSLGGLIARYYKQVLGGRVDKLACLATPHYGTNRAKPWTKLPLAKEITPDSETVKLLYATRAKLQQVKVCSYVAGKDSMVLPIQSAALEDHPVVYLQNLGHQSILFDKDVWHHLAEFLFDSSHAKHPKRAGSIHGLPHKSHAHAVGDAE